MIQNGIVVDGKVYGLVSTPEGVNGCELCHFRLLCDILVEKSKLLCVELHNEQGAKHYELLL